MIPQSSSPQRVVTNQADKDLAGIREKSVSGTFSVTSDLTVENRK